LDSTAQGRDFLEDCERIHREWDTHARSLDTDSLISLYAQDAILETPLVPAIFEGRNGVLRGHREIRPFFEEGAPPTKRTCAAVSNRQLVHGRQTDFGLGVSTASARRRSNRAHGSNGNRAWFDPTSSHLLGLVWRQSAYAERDSQGDADDIAVAPGCDATSPRQK